MQKFQTSFSVQSLHLCFVFTAKNYRNSKKCNKRNCEIISKKTSGTWCLSQSSDSKFVAYSFSVTLRVLLKIRDVTDVNLLDAR